MTRFLVYVSPAVGHTLPLVPALLELQRRGHDVHVCALSERSASLRRLDLFGSFCIKTKRTLKVVRSYSGND